MSRRVNMVSHPTKELAVHIKRPRRHLLSRQALLYRRPTTKNISSCVFYFRTFGLCA